MKSRLIIGVLILGVIAITWFFIPKAHATEPCDHNPTWKKMVTNSKDELARLSVLCWDGGGHTETYELNRRVIQVYCYNGTGYPTGIPARVGPTAPVRSVGPVGGPIVGSITVEDRLRRNELVRQRILVRKAEEND